MNADMRVPPEWFKAKFRAENTGDEHRMQEAWESGNADVPNREVTVTLFVVLERTGRWSGTEQYHHVEHVFATRAEAAAYVADQASKRNCDLWMGEVFEATKKQ